MALRRPSRKKKPKPTPRMLDMGKGRFKPKKSKKTPNPHKDSGDKMKKRDTRLGFHPHLPMTVDNISPPQFRQTSCILYTV